MREPQLERGGATADRTIGFPGTGLFVASGPGPTYDGLDRGFSECFPVCRCSQKNAE